MNTPGWIVIIALDLALSMPAAPVSAAPSASITITQPLLNPVQVGSEVSFALVITVNEIMPGVSGADIYLGYDDRFVAPPTSPNSVVEALPDFFGVSDISIKEILPATQCPGGASPCVHLVAAGPAQETHSGAVARFHFLGIARGEACFTVLASTLANKDGFPVDHTRAERRCVIIDGDPPVIGTVLRQGMLDKPNSAGGTLACSEVTLDRRVFTDPSGRFEFTNVSSGTYPLRAAYSGHLVSEKTITIPGGTTTIDAGTTTLCGGDVNADYKINILDIGAIIGKFGACNVEVRSDLSIPPVFPADCTDPDEPRDINDDGCVNIFDLAIAAGNWGKKGPTPWRTDQCDP